MLLDTVLPNNRSGKVVQTKCETCGHISTVNWGNYIKSQKTRGLSGKTYCRPCSCRMTVASRTGKPAWNKGLKLGDDQKGENHPSWRGGRYIDARGYVMIFVGSAKGTSKWSSYKKEHILVMEKHLGRSLVKGETVHHIDGDKVHNDISNLFLCSNPSHKCAHNSLQLIGYSLVKLGLIKFDHIVGKYVAHTKWDELLEQLEVADQQPSLGGDPSEGSETRSRDSSSQ